MFFGSRSKWPSLTVTSVKLTYRKVAADDISTEPPLVPVALIEPRNVV